jgi:ABC-type sugar transport system ATPase subunit
VLRDGREIATVGAAGTTQAGLVTMMTGSAQRAVVRSPRGPAAEPLLRARWPDHGGAGELVVHRGEILGLAGLVGAGRTRLARKLAGLDRAPGLAIELAGRALGSRSPGEALRRGLVYLTEDRKRDGLFASLSVVENVSAAALSRFTTAGVLARRRERAAARTLLERLRLVARSLDMPAGQLSGGNQQKLLMARALLVEPKVLICDEPTRGIDVAAKQEIYEILAGLAGRGVAVIVVSSELEELLAVTDRLLVMRAGRVVAELATAETSEAEVLALAAGSEGAAAR